MELLSIGVNARSIDAIQIVKEIANMQSTKEFFISLNTHDQLFDEGIDKRGVKLESIGGPYSPNTIEGVPGQYPGKRDLGLPTDRITLYQTGDFYNSFRVTIQWPDVIIEADDNKEGIRLNDEWGGFIIGWTPESKRKAENYLLERTAEVLLQRLLS